jgi:hypothetical protein
VVAPVDGQRLKPALLPVSAATCAQYLKENPDYHNPAFNTKFGVYSEGCGLDNVLMSWGHDDYMCLVAKENKSTLPSAGLFIIRYHSFYRKRTQCSWFFFSAPL